MTYELLWTKNAKRQIELIIDFHLQISPNVAKKLIVVIKTKLDNLTSFPHMGKTNSSVTNANIKEIYIEKYRII